MEASARLCRADSAAARALAILAFASSKSSSLAFPIRRCSSTNSAWSQARTSPRSAAATLSCAVSVLKYAACAWLRAWRMACSSWNSCRPTCERAEPADSRARLPAPSRGRDRLALPLQPGFPGSVDPENGKERFADRESLPLPSGICTSPPACDRKAGSPPPSPRPSGIASPG